MRTENSDATIALSRDDVLTGGRKFVCDFTWPKKPPLFDPADPSSLATSTTSAVLDALWSVLQQHVEAVVDTPVSYIYDELRVAFPNATVLLSTRNATAWAASRLAHHGATALICKESVVRLVLGPKGKHLQWEDEPAAWKELRGRQNPSGPSTERTPGLPHPFAMRPCAERCASLWKQKHRRVQDEEVDVQLGEKLEEGEEGRLPTRKLEKTPPYSHGGHVGGEEEDCLPSPFIELKGVAALVDSLKRVARDREGFRKEAASFRDDLFSLDALTVVAEAYEMYQTHVRQSAGRAESAAAPVSLGDTGTSPGLLNLFFQSQNDNTRSGSGVDDDKQQPLGWTWMPSPPPQFFEMNMWADPACVLHERFESALGRPMPAAHRGDFFGGSVDKPIPGRNSTVHACKLPEDYPWPDPKGFYDGDKRNSSHAAHHKGHTDELAP
jgi:hypothetical protein